jgi:hypothetical protein
MPFLLFPYFYGGSLPTDAAVQVLSDLGHAGKRCSARVLEKESELLCVANSEAENRFAYFTSSNHSLGA